MSAELAWAEALERLEANLAGAETLVAELNVDAVTDWAVVSLEGPIPEHLVERARELAARQQKLIDAIPAVMAATSERLRGTHRFRSWGRAERPAVYVDVSA
ncbi:hypothetical protein [Nocardioides sp. Kera G14]|uniref:hypothetical protein n=1 Tax=Nocardioides sp. Kera G14 TaxID=2884264 RepID=UPI001D0F8D9A|nr:hypothetical protein [Nocardioides sp. Kera G14]UDY24086.1 hypothetical protein LH076_01960 [Nocardioides sp. Kera G14]